MLTNDRVLHTTDTVVYTTDRSRVLCTTNIVRTTDKVIYQPTE